MQEDTANTQKSVELQMLYAGAQAPKKARSRLAQMVFNTATARQDAENAERIKWIACLSQLVAGTATPLGQRLVQRPTEAASMGLGLRAGTLRNRAHVLRRYFLWLAQSFRLPFPEQEEHYLDYLALRVQEPCTRCTLKCVHQSFVYLEEVSEIQPHRRVTVRQRYSNMLAELVSRTLPGSPSRQAPRPLLRILQSVESLLTNESVAVYIRVFGWFSLLQAWCTLSFDDHRGLEAASIRDSPEAFSAVLTRSKTHGPDRGPERRVVYMDKACWLHEPSWFDVGYQLLMRLAPYERDCLLPSPGPHCGGIRQAELSYDGALAALGRLLRTLQSEDKDLLIPQLCSYWTPHSPRSFLPTCCAALGVHKKERDVLGRWAKQGSDRYVRISRMIIQRLQLLAAHTLRGRPDAAALIGEAESLSELQEFLRERGLPQDQIDLQAWRLNSELSRKFSVQVKPKHDLFTPIEEQERMLREEVLFQQSEGR